MKTAQPTILVTGKNSQVGHELLRTLGGIGHVVSLSTQDCDFCDPPAIQTMVRKIKPQLIKDPAAYTNPGDEYSLLWSDTTSTSNGHW